MRRQTLPFQLAADRPGETGVSNPSGEGFAYRDHQLDTAKAPLFEVGDELSPEGLGLAVAHLENHELAAAMEDHGIQVHIGVSTALQRLARKACTCWSIS